MENRYLYVIGPDAGPLKIGIATGLAARLTQLQVGSRDRLRIHWAEWTENAAEVERRIHQLFRGRCISGEWFNVDLPSITKAIALATHGVEC